LGKTPPIQTQNNIPDCNRQRRRGIMPVGQQHGRPVFNGATMVAKSYQNPTRFYFL
jgi:hypothetical protein